MTTRKKAKAKPRTAAPDVRQRLGNAFDELEAVLSGVDAVRALPRDVRDWIEVELAALVEVIEDAKDEAG